MKESKSNSTANSPQMQACPSVFFFFATIVFCFPTVLFNILLHLPSPLSPFRMRTGQKEVSFFFSIEGMQEKQQQQQHQHQQQNSSTHKKKEERGGRKRN
jgi:hypothetical protein